MTKPPILRIDFETRSVVDLPKTGVHIYAEDPTTDVWCMAWAFDDEPVEIWIKGEELPERIRDHVESGGLVGAWNAAFELAIWNKVMRKDVR
jgi:DNA polymerase bacteriophage-type